MSTPAPGAADLLVEQAMHPGILACGRETPLSDVAEMMARHRVHAIVVHGGDGDDLWGVVSDLDVAAAAGVRDLASQTAGGSAATAVLMVSPHESLRRAAQLMTEHATAHLVVADPSSGRPVGVLSTLDVARALARDGVDDERQPRRSS
jgi:CBS domain-containing protein